MLYIYGVFYNLVGSMSVAFVTFVYQFCVSVQPCNSNLQQLLLGFWIYSYGIVMEF